MEGFIKFLKLFFTYMLGLITVEAAMNVSVVILILFIAHLCMLAMSITAIKKLGYTVNILKLLKNTIKEFSIQTLIICLIYSIDDLALHHLPYFHLAEYIGVVFCIISLGYIYVYYAIITTKPQGLKFVQDLVLHNASNLIGKYGISIDQKKIDELNLTAFAQKIVKKEAEQ